MMSLEYIRQIQHERAVEAAQKGLKPFVYATNDEVNELPFPFPFIGDYEPEGWELVETHFVDSSGFGEPGEPALTVEQFQDVIRKAIHVHAAEEHKATGWAVVEAGQFQVCVGEFTRLV